MTVKEKAIGLFDFSTSSCFDSSLSSKAPRRACLPLFRKAIKQLGNKSNHIFLESFTENTEENSTGQMLNQNVSTYLNTLLSAKARCQSALLPPSLPSSGVLLR